MTEQYGYNAMEHCAICDIHVDDCSCCAPTMRTKIVDGYTTDDGQAIPSHALYRYECQCGDPRHQGTCWYASHDRAFRSYERRVEASPLEETR